jgi:hypothetical protein
VHVDELRGDDSHTAVLVRGHGPVVEPDVASIAPACTSRGSASTQAE